MSLKNKEQKLDCIYWLDDFERRCKVSATRWFTKPADNIHIVYGYYQQEIKIVTEEYLVSLKSLMYVHENRNEQLDLKNRFRNPYNFFSE